MMSVAQRRSALRRCPRTSSLLSAGKLARLCGEKYGALHLALQEPSSPWLVVFYPGGTVAEVACEAIRSISGRVVARFVCVLGAHL